MVRKRKSSNEPTPETSSPSPSKWHNWWIRTTTTILLISGFTLILRLGHPWLILLIIAIQIQIYKEVISIASYPSKQKELPGFQSMSWYFLISTNYFLYGESLIWYFKQHVLAGTLIIYALFIYNLLNPSLCSILLL